MGDHFGKRTALSLIYFLNYAYLAIWPGLLFFGTHFITNPLDLFRHISKQHGSLRPFACTECPKAYLHLKDLERHFTSTHEKEGKLNGRFECEECSKVFTHLYLLNCHKMCEHAEKKPFQCDQCTQNYTSKEGLKRHKLTVHEGNYH